jgi:hypothetical protein
MKKIKAIFCLLLLNIAMAISQPLTVLNKSDTFIAPDDGTIVMDKFTYGKYHYTAEKYDTLKNKIIEYDSLLTARDSINGKVIADFEYLVSQKETEKEVYKSGYEDATKTLQSSLDKNRQLQIDYKKLEHKNGRIKRWRNIFAGSSFCFGAVIILIVAL